MLSTALLRSELEAELNALHDGFDPSESLAHATAITDMQADAPTALADNFLLPTALPLHV